MTELKPCPFCGSDQLEFDPDTQCIICEKCGGFGPNPTEEVAKDDTLTDEQLQEHAAAIWNKRAKVVEPPAIKCEIKDCPNDAAYEGWYRRRDPFLGTPTGHIVRIAFCKSCKAHPHLCVNEPKTEKTRDEV